jgi:hypothetical protein
LAQAQPVLSGVLAAEIRRLGERHGVLWDIVETELPALRGKIAALLRPTS